MIGLVIGVIFIIFIFILMYPIRVLVRHRLRSLKEKETASKEKLKDLKLMAEDDKQVALKNGQRMHSYSIEGKYKAQENLVNIRYSSEIGTLTVINNVTKFVQYLMSFTVLISAVLLGAGVGVSIILSSIIPAIAPLTGQGGGEQQVTQSKEGSSKKKDNSDTSLTGKSLVKGTNSAVQAFVAMVQAGMPENWASGQMGSLMQETAGGSYNLQPNAQGGAYYGIVQWGGARYTRLMGMENPHSLETQINFMITEMKERGIFKKAKANPKESVSETASYFANTYEVGADVGLRIQYANRFDKDYVQNGKYKQYLK